MLILEKLSETACKIAAAWKWCYLCFGLPSKYILNSNVLECGAFSFQSPDHREVPKSKHIILVQFFAVSQPHLSRL